MLTFVFIFLLLASLQPEVEALCKKVTTLKVDVEDGENESIKSSTQTQNSSFG